MKTVDGDGLFSAWDKHNPRMRAGLLMLVSKVIKRANQLKRRGISADSDRLFWAIQAKIVLTSMLKLVPKFDKMDYEDQRDKVQERQEADHRSDALLDAWKAVFAAWIVHGPLFAPRRQMLLSSQDMYHDFREFVQLHAGDRLPVSGAVIAIEPYDLPRDARQFGNKFAKSITDLERVTGWRAISTRNSVQRMWVLTPKVQNLI